ncbi:16S rRNA (guanine(966)-N(2))-methyltransferase RsmD [Comamonadaceae bacterium OH2545_COT-014]|nr:16S rRNA (guanine(966)-N(2))-methyltransferase RsmD [Comamonadaceae bacterium OH2545_COT-014]
MPRPASPVRAAAPHPKPSTRAGASARPAGDVRLIGGQWKRTRLPVPAKPGLRPTPDRVRETLFNWLGQDLTGWRAVDAFTGTGALGLEAASRGAARVLLLEQDAALAAALRAHQQRLHASAVQVQRGDGLAALRALPAASVDLVFLDPPFDAAHLFAPALAAAAAAVRPGGYVYLEAPARHDHDSAALASLGLAPHRYLKAGAVHAHLLQRSA